MVCFKLCQCIHVLVTKPILFLLFPINTHVMETLYEPLSNYMKGILKRTTFVRYVFPAPRIQSVRNLKKKRFQKCVHWSECRLAPVLVTIFHQCVISYSYGQSYSDGLALYLFSPTLLINSIKHEHSFKILAWYLQQEAHSCKILYVALPKDVISELPLLFDVNYNNLPTMNTLKPVVNVPYVY